MSEEGCAISRNDEWLVVAFDSETVAVSRWEELRRSGELPVRALYPGEAAGGFGSDLILRMTTSNADKEALLQALADLPWRAPRRVQVLVRAQDSDVYALYVWRGGRMEYVPQPDTTLVTDERVANSPWLVLDDADATPT